MLTSCGFQLTFDKLHTYHPPTWVLLSSIMLFEFGSATCATAPNSMDFVIGRAVAGMGSSGIYSGAVILIVYIFRFAKDASIVFGVASVEGSLLSGLFTSKVSWRWWCALNNMACTMK